MASSPRSNTFTAMHSMPAIPVPLTGNVRAFFVRKISRSIAHVWSMIARYWGSRCPSVGAAMARSTRWGTGLGPGPIKMRSFGIKAAAGEVSIG